MGRIAKSQKSSMISSYRLVSVSIRKGRVFALFPLPSYIASGSQLIRQSGKKEKKRVLKAPPPPRILTPHSSQKASTNVALWPKGKEEEEEGQKSGKRRSSDTREKEGKTFFLSLSALKSQGRAYSLTIIK